MTEGGARRLLDARWFIPVVTFFIVMGVWQLVGTFTNPLLFSTPVGIVQVTADMLSASGALAIWPATLVTLQSLAIGFFIAVAVGIPLGLAMGMWSWLDVALNPYVNALYVTPRIALIPLIVIWFGIGTEAIVFVVFLTTVFVILINTYAGVKNASRSFVDTAEVFEVHGLQRFRKVIFPATAPFIMTGLRLGVAQALIGVIVAELVLSLEGLGYLLTDYGEFFETAQTLWVIVELMIIGVILVGSVQYLERRISHWKQTERAFR